MLRSIECLVNRGIDDAFDILVFSLKVKKEYADSQVQILHWRDHAEVPADGVGLLKEVGC